MSNGNREQRNLSFYCIAISTTATISSILLYKYYYYWYIIKISDSLSPKNQRRSKRRSTFICQKSSSMWRNVGVQDEGEQDNEEEEEEEESDEEINRQRDIIYNTIIPLSSPHGVPSLMKTLDSALLLLKVTCALDKRLQNIPKIDEFFEYLCMIEQESVRTARNGFNQCKVLVIEGLMSSGKSTLINGIKNRIQATAITALPARFLEIKHLFNSADAPEAILTALDYIFNYCIAHQILLDAASQPQGRRMKMCIIYF